MKKGGDTSAKARANGKNVGRPRKQPIVQQKADKSIATIVLAMDGPPNHTRKCECEICNLPKKEQKCECKQIVGEKLVLCHYCQTRAEHRICHCEVCGWWETLLAKQLELRFRTREYLTNKRDGKPAESVIAEGKLEIVVRELGVGDSSATEAGVAEEVM